MGTQGSPREVDYPRWEAHARVARHARNAKLDYAIFCSELGANRRARDVS